MPDPIPDEAVEAAARMLCVVTNYGTLGPRCDTHEWVVPIADPTHCEYGDEIARAALTAAAPLIAAQATTDLRAGIEALRDEWRYDDGKDRSGTSDELVVKCFRRASRALDALLRERAR